MKTENYNGRSMIEMLGVLAIIGVLSVGGIAGYTKAMLQYKVNKTIEQINSIVTNTRTLYASQSGDAKYIGLCEYYYDEESERNEYNCYNLDIPRLQGLFDDVEEDGKLASGKLEFFSCNAETSEHLPAFDGDRCDSFELWISELTKEECLKLSTYDWGNVDSSGLIAIGVSPLYVPLAVPGDFGMYHGNVARGCSGGTYVGDSYVGNFSEALACSGGSALSVPMPINIAATACNCPENTCNVVLFYE